MKKYALFLLLVSACNSSETITTATVEEPASRVLEYTPAPGQFINSSLAGFPADAPITTPEAAAAYAQARLNMGGTPDPDAETVSYGFVSPVEPEDDVSAPGAEGPDYDLYVTGNSFNGPSEPGIVWVAQDSDGDDSHVGETWYELKGSEYDNPKTRFGYEATYVEQADGTVAWTDNKGGDGSIDRTIHTQSYVPAWVQPLTYAGTRLPDNVEPDTETGIYDLRAFAWGYVDNASSIDGAGMKNRFKIANAVDADGNPANLRQIDFVKIQTGVNCKAGNGVGEISTEVCGVGCYRTVTRTE